MKRAEVPSKARRWRDETALVLDELRTADIVVVTMWSLFVVVGIVDLYQYYRRGIFGLDFATVWSAAHALLHHHTKWGQFVYLPGCLVFVFPLAVIPLSLARLIVYPVQFLGLGYTFWAITRISKRSLGSRGVAGAALALAVAGQVGVAANYENFTLLLVPLAAAFFLAVDRSHYTAAAIALGISLTIKPLLLPLLVVFLVRRLWRYAAIAVIIPLALTALAFVVIAISGSPAQFFHEVFVTFGSNNAAPVNASISGVGDVLGFPSWLTDFLRVVLALACIDVSRRMWRRPFGSPGEQAIWLTAPLLVGMILCFTFAWAYYAVLFLPLALITLDRKDLGARLILAGAFIALLLPVLPDLIKGYPSPHPTDDIALLGLLVLLAGTALMARSSIVFGAEEPSVPRVPVGAGVS
ncbi:MAG TPA: glycosyltransferase family 87 protein [Acidimicrobiales bacterium]